MGKDIYLTLTFLLTITSFVIVLGVFFFFSSVYAGRAIVNASKPVLNDPNLTVDLVFSGLKKPTSMIFLGPDDVLVAQKNEGTVERIVNGVKIQSHLLQFLLLVKMKEDYSVRQFQRIQLVKKLIYFFTTLRKVQQMTRYLETGFTDMN